MVDSVSTIDGAATAPAGPGLRAVLFGRTHHVTAALPLEGRVRIGRSPECEICFEDPALSRVHAELIAKPGSVFELADLGSSNGTNLRGQPLVLGTPAPIAIGECADLGGITLVVQWAPKPVAHPLGSTLDLERRLLEELARTERTDRSFVLLRLSARDEDLERALVGELAVFDTVVRVVPGTYEVLLPEQDRAAGERMLDRIRARLVGPSELNLVSRPEDGRNSETLLRRLRAQHAAEEPEHVPNTRVPPVSLAMRQVYALVDRVATSELSVLLLGETGVGKEVIAEAIHARSKRAGAPLLRLHCGALPESLIESELFGYERGAFTGASQAKPGLIETADGGTVFLDEIGELPLLTQAKLLRVLEDRMILRLGATKPHKADVRFIAATNRDLGADVDLGRFRRDLYFRLNGIAIEIPPLRDRREEIEPLARWFLTRALDGREGSLSDAVLRTLWAHPWPGNVRELRQTIERAAVLAGTTQITTEHVALERATLLYDSNRVSIPSLAVEPGEPLADHRKVRGTPELVRAEIKRIQDALEESGGNQTRAAERLGVSRSTLLARIETYGLPRPKKR